MIQRFIADWRAVPQLTPLLFLLLAIPAAFYATTASMVDIWWVNETFTHGFLILPISLWLVWGQREHIRALEMERDFRALVLVIPTLLLWFVATAIDVAVVQQLSMVALIPATVWLILGLALTRALLFPLLYLFFAVPLGQSLIPPMMEFTADFTVYMVQLSGVPIFRDGLSFQLPSGSWSVVEECSGVRYLIASAALGTIYAYITYQSFTKRAIFILVSLLVPIAANGLRAYGIVMIGHLSGMRYAVGADHLLYGWVFFGIVIFILFWIGGYWADSPAPETGTPQERDRLTQDSDYRKPAIICVAVLAAFSLLTVQAFDRVPELPESASLQLPQQIGTWTQAGNRVDSWHPDLQNPDLYATRRYSDGDRHVQLDLAYFHAQRPEAEAISSLNRIANPYDSQWKLIAARSFNSGELVFEEWEASRGTEKVLVWSTYLIGQSYVANAYRAKLFQALAQLRGDQSASWVTLSTDYDDDLGSLRDRLEMAWRALEGPVRSAAQNAASPVPAELR